MRIAYLELTQVVAQDATQWLRKLVWQTELRKVEDGELWKMLQSVHYGSRSNGHFIKVVVDLWRTKIKQVTPGKYRRAFTEAVDAMATSSM